MKKKKGFTLIEGIMVVAIIGILSLILIPNVLGVIQKNKVNSYNSMIDSVINASKVYISDKKNSSDIINNIDCSGNKELSLFCIPVQSIIDSGDLSEKFVNPLNGDKIETKDASGKFIDTEQVLVVFYCRTKNFIYKYRPKIKKISDEIVKFNPASCNANLNFIINDYNALTNPYNKKGNNNWYVTEIKVDVEVSGIDDYQYCIKKANGACNYLKRPSKDEIFIKDDGSFKVCAISELTGEICTDTINIDKTPPKAPTISLINNTIKLSNSDSDAKYYYNFQNNSNFINGNSVVKEESTTIYAKTIDSAGNESNIVSKELHVEDAKNGSVTSKLINQYYCDLTQRNYNTQSEAKNACNQTQTYQGTLKYKCSYNGQYYSSQSSAESACTKTDSVSRYYYCSYSDNYQSSSTCYEDVSGNVSEVSGCPDGRSPSGGQCYYDLADTTRIHAIPCNKNCNSSNTSCYWNENTISSATCVENCSSEQRCNTGYTKGFQVTNDQCADLGKQICYQPGNNNKANCSITYSGWCSAQIITEYRCSLDGETYSSRNTAKNNCTESEPYTGDTYYYCRRTSEYYRNSSSANSACTYSTGTVGQEYYCSYDSKYQSSSTCTKTILGSVSDSSYTNYYCSLNSSQIYSTKISAQSACTNVCLTGSFYSGKCYKLS